MKAGQGMSGPLHHGKHAEAYLAYVIAEKGPAEEDRGARSEQSTRFRGVYQNRHDGKWRAEITSGGSHLAFKQYHSSLHRPVQPLVNSSKYLL